MRTQPRRRFLVLTSEAARHPFRASLPPQVREPLREDEAAPQQQRNWRISRRDWRDVLATWCATFVAVTIFIA
jgi:hypothetical protein